MKRIFLFFLIAILLVPFGVEFSYGAIVTDGVSMTAYQVNQAGIQVGTPVYVGESFRLELYFQNTTSKPITNIDQLSISLDTGASIARVSQFTLKPSTTNNDFALVADMYYSSSGSKTITATVGFDIDSSNKFEKSFAADLVFLQTGSGTGTPGTPTVVDEPRLIIENLDLPTGDAGETIDLDLTVKNNSNYMARDISVSILLDQVEDTPFQLAETNSKRFISALSVNRAENISFRLKIKDTAPAKTYAVKFQFDYVNSLGEVFSSVETIYINVTNEKLPPKIMISSIDYEPTNISAGGTTRLVFNFKNEGTLPARNIQVFLEGLTNEGFTLVNDTNSRFIRELTPGKQTYAYFDLTASPRIKDGNHNLTVKIQYQDEQRESYTETHIFSLPVGNALSGGPELEITNIQSPSMDLEPNDSFDVSFDLENLGQGIARNIKVSVDGKEVLLPKSQQIRALSSLAAGAATPLNFSFYIDSEATERNHPLLITVEYDEDSEGTRQTIQQYVGINVVDASSDGSGSSTPKIIIDQYQFIPQIVRAGENFDLSVSFLNTNNKTAVQNVRIFLTVNETTEESGSVFTPVNSSNTFYIDYIPTKGTVGKNLTLYTVPDAKPKTYTIEVNLEYEDEEGEVYTAKELIGIPVVQQARLEVSDFSLPTEVFMGQPSFLFMEFYNMGKVTLSNMMIKVEGNFQVQNGSYFVGNFEPGYSDYFEVTVIPMEPGPLAGDVIFSYEDAAGEVVEVRKPISSTTIEMFQEPFPPGEPFPPMEEPPSLVGRLLKNKIFWGVAIVALGGGGFLIRKRIKKKKGMAEDEIY